MTAYYNEFDKFAAEWLRQLIKAGHIAPGIVDERSIEDVTPGDLAGFTQCHFFAGIGVWSYALRRAGWSDSRRVWTASCPCQPFSAAGQGVGFADERHLWPAFYHLASQCRPDAIYGEQVASKDAGPWIDLVHTDMEALGYAFGAVPFPSAGIGAPHIRDRLYWVANASGTRTRRDTRTAPGAQGGMRSARNTDGGNGGDTPVARGAVRGMADTDNHMHDEPESPNGASDFRADERGPELRFTGCSAMVRPGPTNGPEVWRDIHGELPRYGLTEGRDIGGMANANGYGSLDGVERANEQRAEATAQHCGNSRWSGPTNGHWADADWLYCRDGKWRPVEPGTFPLAHGAAARVGRLRGYGNAINAVQAQIFIEATLTTPSI